MKIVLLRLFGTLSLAALVAGLGYTATMQSGDLEDDSIDPVPTELAGDGGLEPPTLNARPSTYFAPILERPVFEVTRRPIQPSAAQQAKPAREPPPIQAPPRLALPKVSLLGVMSGTNGAQALLSVDGAEPVWFNEGDAVGGWTIATTGTDWLELAADDESIRLELFE